MRGFYISNRRSAGKYYLRTEYCCIISGLAQCVAFGTDIPANFRHEAIEKKRATDIQESARYAYAEAQSEIEHPKPKGTAHALCG
jgi:hypothetical protein